MRDTVPRHAKPAPSQPRFPKPEEVDQYVEHDSTEDTGIVIGLLTFHRPKQVNRAYWYWFQKWSPRQVVWVRLVAVGWLLCFAIMTACLVLAGFGVHLVSNFRYVTGFYCLVMVLHHVVVGKKPKRVFSREILEQEGLVCFDCGYSLQNLPDQHTGPECGTAYEKYALQARRRAWMKPKTR